MIGLGTLLLVALSRPALAQRCLSFRPPAFFAGSYVAPGYPSRPTATPCTRTTRTRFPRHRASGSVGAASTDTCSSGETRASPATRSPAAIAGSGRAAAPPKPALAAEVQVDRIPELLGEMERCPPGSDDPAGVHSWKHAGVAQSGSASDL